jgi:hypothetical protein
MAQHLPSLITLLADGNADVRAAVARLCHLAVPGRFVPFREIASLPSDKEHHHIVFEEVQSTKVKDILRRAQIESCME